MISISNDQYTLETNTSDNQIVFVLLQDQEDGSNRPTGY